MLLMDEENVLYQKSIAYNLKEDKLKDIILRVSHHFGVEEDLLHAWKPDFGFN